MKLLLGLAILCVTFLVSRFITTNQMRPHPMTYDTVNVVTTVYDTVTVISRAADTVRVVIKDVGPLTEQEVARFICGREGLLDPKGDNRFRFNVYGQVFCPERYKE